MSNPIQVGPCGTHPEGRAPRVPNLRRLLAFALAFSLHTSAFALATTNGTPVHFSVRSFTAGALNRKITLTPKDPVMVSGTNVVAGGPIVLQPVRGEVTANLWTGDYRVAFEGISKLWNISVPDTNVTVEAYSLTADLATYTYTNLTVIVVPGATDSGIPLRAGSGVTVANQSGTNVVSAEVGLAALASATNAIHQASTNAAKSYADAGLATKVGINDLASASVSHATTADSATSATTADSATTARSLSGTGTNLLQVVKTNDNSIPFWITDDGKLHGDGSELTGVMGGVAGVTASGSATATTNVSGVVNIEVTGAPGEVTLPRGLVTNVISITDYGAIGNGSTDNTVAISNAFWRGAQSNWWVYVPPGVFMATNLTASGPGIYGSGSNSVLSFAAAGTGVFITTGPGVTLKDFTVSGGNTNLWRHGTNAAGTRIGILHDPSRICSVERMNIHGFDLSGLEIGGEATMNASTNGAFYADNWIHNCFFGYTNQVGTGEYTRIHNNRIWENHIGLTIHGPNMLVEDNFITECYYGGFWRSTASGRGHSKWIRNTFNHLGEASLTVVSNNYGGVIAENSFYAAAGGIKIDNCAGMNIFGNVGDGVHITVDQGGNAHSTGILFYGNIAAGMIDYTSGQLIHWSNYGTDGTLVDGTGAPFYASGGFGMSSANTLIVRSPSWFFAQMNGNAGGLTNLQASAIVGGVAGTNFFATGVRMPKSTLTTSSNALSVDFNKPDVTHVMTNSLTLTNSINWPTGAVVATVDWLFKGGNTNRFLSVNTNWTGFGTYATNGLQIDSNRWYAFTAKIRGQGETNVTWSIVPQNGTNLVAESAPGNAAWHDAGGFAAATDFSNLNPVVLESTPIVLPAGTATQLRVGITNYSGSGTVKLALYNASKSLIASNSVVVSANGWAAVNVNATVSAGTNWLAWVPVDGSMGVPYKSSGTIPHYYDVVDSGTITDPLVAAGGGSTFDFAVGVYVQE